MRKLYYAIIAIIALLALAGGFWLMPREAAAPIANVTPPTPPPQAKDPHLADALKAYQDHMRELEATGNPGATPEAPPPADTPPPPPPEPLKEPAAADIPPPPSEPPASITGFVRHKSSIPTGHKTLPVLSKETQKTSKPRKHHAAKPVQTAHALPTPPAPKRANVPADDYRALLDDGSFAAQSDSIIAHTKNNPEQLRQFGMVAQQNGFDQQARKAFETLIINDPHDTDALREAGIAAYTQADYSASELYLSEYIRTKGKPAPDSYRAYFYYAQMLRHHHGPHMAQDYYRAALTAIHDADLQTADALSVKAQSLTWLEGPDSGLKSFEDARAAYPANDLLRASQAGLLIELERYDEARALLATPPGAEFAAAPTPLPTGNSQNIKGYRLYNNGHALLLYLTHPLAKTDALSPRQLQTIPWIDSASEGHNTLLAATKPGYKFVIDKQNGTTIARAAIDEQSPAYQNMLKTRLLYDMLNARIDMQTGHAYDATRRFAQLLKDHPNDPQLLAFAANAENDGGNWPRAEQLIKTARLQEPQNEDMARFERDVRRLHAQNITLSHDWVRYDNSNDYITTLSGLADVNNHVQVGLSLQNNDAHLKNARLSDGRTGSFSGNRSRGDIFAQYRDDDGQHIKASLFANNDTPGGGLSYGFLSPLGQSTITGEWHKSYWDTPEAVLDQANRDRIAVQQILKPLTRLSVTIEPALNRYNVKETDNVLSTASGNLSASYRLLDDQPFLSLVYGLDAEYILNHKKATDGSGNFTPLLPLYSREIHSIALSAGYEFNSDTYGELLGGYAYDRMGGNGPIVSGKITHELTEKWDVQLHAQYGLDPANTNNTASSLGGNLRWRFE